ncbi:MAG: DNRLRE domain-containing protein [Chloroflexi bacterium]|nr:DNRLRE domain-containing protein [Chloroflexota bacterium]
MNRIRKIVRAILSLVAVAPGAALSLADTVTLTPAADAEIRERSPSSNFGNAATVVSGRLGTNAGQERRRALLKFDLAGRIPANAIVTSVVVQVKVMKVPSGPQNSTFALRRVLQAWNENEASWNTRLAPSTAWNSPGAAGTGDASATASSTVAVAGTGSYTFASTSSLITDAQGWLSNPETNFGWLLISQGEGTAKTARHFGAREDAGNASRLVIGFSVPPAATAPTIVTQPQGLSAFVGETVTFDVSASGTEPLSYQWSKDLSALGGATNAALTLTNVTLADEGNYGVMISNVAGSTNSQSAHLSIIGQGPSIERVEAVGATVNITFTVAPTYVLALQSADALSTPAASWTTLTNVTAKFTSQQVVMPESILASPHRFYRLVVTGRVR